MLKGSAEVEHLAAGMKYTNNSLHIIKIKPYEIYIYRERKNMIGSNEHTAGLSLI